MTLKKFWVYDAATDLPKAGILGSLSRDSYINAVTGDTGAARPSFVELGGGEYGVEDGPEYCGFVLTGAGQTPAAIFLEAENVATFGATGNDGLPLAGLTPTWFAAFDSSGSPIAPAITPLSLGCYRSLPMPDGASGLVDFGDGVGADPRFLGVEFGIAAVPAPAPLPPPAPSTATAPSTNQGVPYISDWRARLRSRIFEQFRGLPNIEGIADTVAEQAQELEDAAQQIIAFLTNIDDATGSQLQVLGRIVGQPFTGEDEATYRRRVRARIKANKSSGTGDQLYGVFLAMMGLAAPGHGQVVPFNPGPAQVVFRSFEFLDGPSALVLFNLLVAAKVAGVRLVLETTFDTDLLTLDDADGLTQFGDTYLGDSATPLTGGAMTSAVSS